MCKWWCNVNLVLIQAPLWAWGHVPTKFWHLNPIPIRGQIIPTDVPTKFRNLAKSQVYKQSFLLRQFVKINPNFKILFVTLQIWIDFYILCKNDDFKT